MAAIAPQKLVTPVSPNRSPKQRFLANPLGIGPHRQLVDSDVFSRACDVALLQYQHELTRTITDGNGAGSVGLRLQGAQEFLNVLRGLSETSVAPTPRPDDNLKH